MVPSRLRRELGLTVCSDPGPKGILLPHKVPRFGLLVGKLSFWNSIHESNISARRQKCEPPLELDVGTAGRRTMATPRTDLDRAGFEREFYRSLFMFDHSVTIPP